MPADAQVLPSDDPLRVPPQPASFFHAQQQMKRLNSVAPANDSIALAKAMDVFSVSRCVASCLDQTFAWSMPSYTSMDEARGFGLVYNARTVFVTPVIHIDVTPSALLPVPERMSVVVSVGGVLVPHLDTDSTEIFYAYNQSGRPANRLAFMINANSYATGVYSYTAEVRFWRSGVYTSDTVSGRFMVVKNDLRYGGWAPAGLQTLKIVDADGSALVYESDGSATYFHRPCNTCAFAQPLGDYSRLHPYGANGYTRTYRDGTIVVFNAAGRMDHKTNLFGEATSLEWSGDTLKAIRDPAGWRIRLSYSSGRLSSVSDSMGRTASFGYTNGMLTSITNPGGSQQKFSYYTNAGNAGMMATSIDERGDTTTYYYDHARKLAAIDFPKVQVADSANLVRPRQRTYAAETAVVPGLMYGQGLSTNPRGFHPPEWSNPIFVTPRGHSTSISVDRYEAATAIYEPLPNRYTLIHRDSVSQIRSVRSVRGNHVNFSYDTLGNVLRIADDATGRVDSMSYHTKVLSNGVRVTVGVLDMRSNAQVPQLSVRYSDVRPDSSWIHTYNSAKTRYYMRSDGRPDSIRDPNGHMTKYYYSANGLRNLDSVRVSGRPVRLTRDNVGRVIAQSAPNDMTSQTLFDSRNRVIRTIGPVNDTTLFVYDSLYLREVVDAVGNVYRFNPNALGLDTAQVDPQENVEYRWYDVNGNLAMSRNRRNDTTTYAYDEVDRMISRNSAGQVTTWAHSPTDEFTVAQHAGITDTLNYDLAGRLVRAATVRGGALYGLEYGYTSASMRNLTTFQGPGQPSRTARVYYNLRGSADSLQDYSGRKTRFVYDDDHQLTQTQFPTSPAVTRAMTYSNIHQSSSITYPGNFQLERALARYISQDSLGRSSQVWNSALDTLVLYTHGKNGQLEAANKYVVVNPPPPSDCEVEWDLGMNCRPDQPPILQLVQPWPYAYDKLGNDAVELEPGNRARAVRAEDGAVDTLTYDADGNVSVRKSSNRHQKLYWNALSQLDSVQILNGQMVVSTAHYRYDGLGRRISKRIGNDSTQFIWDGDVIVAEVGANLSVRALYDYVPGSYTPNSVGRDGTQYYYAKDDARNISGTIGLNGALASNYAYSPFGALTAAHGGNPTFGFAGQYYDSETGMYYMRARYYDPQIRRFMSEDPIGLQGDINLYRYAGNNPLNKWDPVGLQATGPCEIICLPTIVVTGISQEERARRGRGTAANPSNRGSYPAGGNGGEGGGGAEGLSRPGDKPESFAQCVWNRTAENFLATNAGIWDGMALAAWRLGSGMVLGAMYVNPNGAPSAVGLAGRALTNPVSKTPSFIIANGGRAGARAMGWSAVKASLGTSATAFATVTVGFQIGVGIGSAGVGIYECVRGE